MIAAIDIDGVVCNTMKEMKYVAHEMGISLRFTQYEPTINGIGPDEKAIHDIVHFIFENRMDRIKPYPDAVEFLPLIARDIGRITFVTARNEKYTAATGEWLNTHFSFPYTLVHKDSSEKAEFIRDEGFGAFVEDRFRTANEAAALGINTYLITRQWNWKRKAHKNVKRVKNLGVVYTDLCYSGVRIK
jgi:uncharacterized HAD superfamily protein